MGEIVFPVLDVSEPDTLRELITSTVSSRGLCAACEKPFGEEVLSAQAAGRDDLLMVVLFHAACRTPEMLSLG